MKNEGIPGFVAGKPGTRVSMSSAPGEPVMNSGIAPAPVTACTLYPGIRLVPGLLQQEIRVYRQTAFFLSSR